MSEPIDGVNTSLAARINRLRAEYEAAWVHAGDGGAEPSVETFLGDTPEPERSILAQALSDIARARRTNGPGASADDGFRLADDGSIPNDFLPTFIDKGKGEETVAPTNLMAVDRHAPSLPPTEAFDNATIAQARAEAGGSSVAPTQAFTRGPSNPSDLPDTVGMDASGLTAEIIEQPPKSRRGRGPREAPRIAGYEILGELGRGGMGVVYKARHKKLDRIVALKMVIAGAHASQDQLDRFILEAQAVARLQHPDIVQVFEVGEHEGLPYFSLEYVEGGTLAGRIGGRPQPPRVAAEMAMILAGAMQVAHRRNIIHRDLKPANILLTAEGLPKITDFGLAKKMEEDSQQTRSGAVMGTPSYMPPEQALGLTDAIGPLADQYALGAILYEMLTGRPPFQGASPLDTLDLVRNTEPVPPTRLQPKVPLDLETICLRAMQKEAHRRYADCEALAEDIRRFLDNRPILARPISPPEKAWRWCRRNPRIAALSAAVVLLMIGATAISSFAAVTISKTNGKLKTQTAIALQNAGIAARNAAAARSAEASARAEAQRADKKAAEARAAEAVAQAERKRAEDSLALANEQSKSLLLGVYEMASSVQEEMKGKPGLRDLQQRLLEIAYARANEVKGYAQKTPGLSHAVAGIHQRLGLIYEQTGKLDEALAEYRICDQMIDALARKYPDDLVFTHILPAKVKNTLADFTARKLGNTEAALVYYKKAYDLRAEVAARAPSDTSINDMANQTGTLANAAFLLGRPDEAARLYKEEIAWRSRMSAEYRQNTEMQREQSGLFEKLGELERMLGRPDEARSSLRRSLELRELIADQNPGNWIIARDVGTSLMKLGDHELMDANDAAGALRAYEKALAELQPLYELDRENLILKGDVSSAEYRVATAYLRLARGSLPPRAGELPADPFAADAAPLRALSDSHYRRCLALRRELAGNPKAKFAEIDLIVALARCGEHAEAARRLDEVMKLPPADNQLYYQAICGYALCRGAVGDADRPLARAYADKAIANLRHAVDYGWKDEHGLRTDPDIDPIRDDPRLEPLLEKVRQAYLASLRRAPRPD